jgi:hypothetical protein
MKSTFGIGCAIFIALLASAPFPRITAFASSSMRRMFRHYGHSDQGEYENPHAYLFVDAKGPGGQVIPARSSYRRPQT